MNQNAKTPPRWMEGLLERLLPAHAREEVVGDLREEYIEAIAPRHGRLRANAWYTRHVLSFIPAALRESKMLGKVLIFFSGFTAVCMFWLALMEMTLRRPGYATRTALEVSFALSCLVAAYLRMLTLPRTRSEACLRGAGLLTILFGAHAFFDNARRAHFEGFVFVISLLLIAEGALMVLTLGRRGENNSRVPAK